MLSLTKVLIHSDYGAYGCFSKEFNDEFQKTYDIDFESLSSYDPYWDKKNKNIDIETRYDERLIYIFEKYNAREYKSSLLIVLVPSDLVDCFCINEYDGAETIWFNTSRKYKDLLFSVIDKKEDVSTIQEKINLIRRCEEYLDQNNIRYM